MPAATTGAAEVIDEDQGILRKQTKGISLKTEATENGVKDIVTGYLATTHIDKGNDQYTKQALEKMASQIRQDADSTINVLYPDVKESQVGNVGHNNNRAAEEKLGFGDTRIVPAFKITEAQVVALPDGEHHALDVKGVLNSEGYPDDVEAAIKNSLKNGLLHSFSIEYIPREVEFVPENGEVIRRIHDAKANGAALTGRPMNKEASVTTRQLKSMAANTDIQLKNTDAIKENDTTGKTMSDETKQDTEPEEEQNAGDEPEEQEGAESPELKTEVEELKSSFNEFKEAKEELESENEELKTENEELKEKLDDFKTLEGIKSEISELKSEIEDADLEDPESTPQAEQGEERHSEMKSEKEEWKRVLDTVSNPKSYIQQKSKKGKTNMDMLKSDYNVSEEEVKEYVRA